MKPHSLIHQDFSALVSHLSSAPIPLSLRSGRSCWLRGQSSRVSPVLDFLLAVLFCSLALLFSHTLWCNVSASSFTFTLSLSLSLATLQTLQWWLSLEGNNKEGKTHTHGSFSSASPRLSHTHTHPWEIKSLLGAGKYFPPLPVAFSSSLTLDAEALNTKALFLSASSLHYEALEFILEPHDQTQNLRTSSEKPWYTTNSPMALESTLEP